MQDTIDTMFVIEKIIRLSILTMNTRQMHFKRSIVTKTSHPPDPLKYPPWWGGYT